MLLYLKESFILLFENYKLLNTESAENKFNMFIETEEGQLVKVLSKYDNTIISMLFNSVLPELTTKLEQTNWISDIQYLLNSNYQNNITPTIKKYTQHLLTYFDDQLSLLNLPDQALRQILILMRMMSEYLNGTHNLENETFNLVRFEEDIQK